MMRTVTGESGDKSSSYDVQGRRQSPRDHKPVDYSDTKRHEQPSSKPKTKVATDPTAIEDLEPDDFDRVRTDYNNPAKSTEQNKPRQFESGPWIGKPSKVDFNNYP